MDSLNRLLLEVWQLACRHLEAEESFVRIAQLLCRRQAFARMLIGHVDTQRSVLETVAAGTEAGTSAEWTRTECRAEEVERLLLWCRTQELFHGPASAFAGRYPGLVALTGSSEILVAPLRAQEDPLGVVILTACGSEEFRPGHEEMLRAVREPLAVLLENEHRLRELAILREAAEADRRSLLSRLNRSDISECIVGAETGLHAVMEQVELVARSGVPVFILGETGSGKEVVARAVHARSRCAAGPFLRVNCGAIPPELVDSELFGHERGSFTGAVGVRKGWFERADGGTLFLDECGELPAAAQVRLLRILQDGTFQRVGGEKTLHVDVRIIAATHRDLRAMVAERTFREDLWYRLSVFPIRLPPLRERIEDIPTLAAHFVARASSRLGMPLLSLTAQDLQALVAYPWPGNVRELASVIERAVILGNGRCLEVAKAVGASGTPQAALPRREAAPRSVVQMGEFLTLDAAMVRHIEEALVRTRGQIEGPQGAAQLLGINPHTLRARMRKLGVRWQSYRQ
jgi:transcriptional regulator with GAF, ATPase, and Fis domain